MVPPKGLAHLLLGQPEIAEGLMRALGLKGATPSYLEPEFGASINLMDLRDPEFVYLRRGTLYSAGATFVALAANFNYLCLANRILSRVALAVVEGVLLSNLSAATLGFWFGINANVTLSGGTLAHSRDDRQNGGIVGSSARAGIYSCGSFQNAADVMGTAGNFALAQIPAGNSLYIPLPGHVLTGNIDSGNGQQAMFTVQTAAVNVASSATIFWREKNVLASELL